MSNVSRRDFLKAGAATLASITVAPSSILGKSFGHIPPSDKLNIAAIGVGGIGHSNINAVKDTENLVALCDVDWNYAKGVFDEFPKAKKYWGNGKIDRRGHDCYSRSYSRYHYSRCDDDGQACVLPKTFDAFCL